MIFEAVPNFHLNFIGCLLLTVKYPHLSIMLAKSSQLIHLFSNQYYKFNMPKIYTNYFIKVISLTKTRPELERRAA